MVLDFKVVASTDGDYPFNKDQIHKLIEDATPANLVESILHKLKATSSKHKFIVTATKITSQELGGSVSCQMGTLWNEKKDGYVTLQIKEREEKSGKEETEKEETEEEKGTIKQSDSVENKEGVENEENVHEEIDKQVVDVLEEYQQQSPKATDDTLEVKEPVPETLEVKELGNTDKLYNDATKEHIGEVSSELIPNVSSEPIEVGSDEPIHAKVPDADIDEAVGSIPTTDANPPDLSAHEEPVMLAAVDPEEAEKIMRERDSGLVSDETKVSLEEPIAQSTPGSDSTAADTTEKRVFEPLEVPIDEHEESTVQPQAIEQEDNSEHVEDVPPEAEHEDEKVDSIKAEPVSKQPKVATTYMVTIYWVYVY